MGSGSAANNTAIRPPSRHKDPPQNIGLDLPPPDSDDLPSIEDDSDSSDEFEIGIENAKGIDVNKRNKNASTSQQQGVPSKRKHQNRLDKQRIPVVADKQWDSDSSNEGHPLIQDSEI